MTWWEPEVLDRERWGAVIDPALERVRRAHRRGLSPHALLVVGPSGLGREVAAVEMAAHLVCGEERAGGAAGADRVRRGVHPDVAVVAPQPPSEQIKIEQVREVTAAVAGRPFEGMARVWILDGVEAGRFGAEAANAFLKTLEEPPEHVHFLLLAANPAAVLPTIRSRCQHLPLPGLVAVSRLAESDLPPELAGRSEASGAVLEGVRRALEAAMAGEVRGLLSVPRLEDGKDALFEVVVAVALEMAGAERWQERAPELVGLASDLLAVESRTRALNLNRERQLLSCLLGWYEDLVPAGAP